MTLCEHCSFPLCDFCKHYRFNGDEGGAYTGEGWCVLHQAPREPDQHCDEFHCGNADQPATASR